MKGEIDLKILADHLVETDNQLSVFDLTQQLASLNKHLIQFVLFDEQINEDIYLKTAPLNKGIAQAIIILSRLGEDVPKGAPTVSFDIAKAYSRANRHEGNILSLLEAINNSIEAGKNIRIDLLRLVEYGLLYLYNEKDGGEIEKTLYSILGVNIR